MDNSLVKNSPSIMEPIRRKESVIFFLKVIIAAGLILFLIEFIKINDIKKTFFTGDFYLVLISFFLVVLNLYLQYLKWETVCRVYLKIDNKKKIFFSLFHGFPAGIFTPARLGEFFGRGLVFPDRPVIQIVSAAFIDKFFSLLVVLFYGMVSSVFFLNYFFYISYYKTTIVLLLISSAAAYLLYNLVKRKELSIIPEKIRQRQLYKKIIIIFKELKNLDHKFSLRMIFLSSGFYLCYLIQFALLISAFSHHFSLFGNLWTGSVIMFTKTFIPQISIGELGIRETVSIYFFTKMGLTSAAAFNASIFLFLINLVFPSVIGSLLLNKKKYD